MVFFLRTYTPWAAFCILDVLRFAIVAGGNSVASHDMRLYAKRTLLFLAMSHCEPRSHFFPVFSFFWKVRFLNDSLFSVFWRVSLLNEVKKVLSHSTDI